MMNHFNFDKKGDEFLLTNDFGEYVFLSQEEFKNFVNGNLDKTSECYAMLESRGFVSTKKPEVFISEHASRIRSMKSYLFTATALHIFAVTNCCNQSCVYCQAKAPGSKLDGMMSIETGKKAIEVAMQSPAKHLTFEFQGGEPLLNLDVVFAMIDYSKELNQHYNKELEYTLVSNIIALTDDKFQALIDHNISICTSLDGCELVHNHNRKLHNGEGTFDLVQKGIAKVRAAGRSVGAIETTTRFSLEYPKEIVDSYLNAGVVGIFLRPLTPLGFAKAYWEEFGYSPEEFLEFYKEAFKYILSINAKGVYFPELHATYFLRKILDGCADNYMELRSPCGAGIGQMSYYYDGNVYTCDEGRMLSEGGNYSFKLGNVHNDTYDEMICKSVCKSTCAASVVESLPNCCDCVYHPYCGVCPVVAFASDNDIFPRRPFDYRCKIYKGLLDILFEKIKEEHPVTMHILKSWIEG